MEFKQIKNFCKYAETSILCPDNYKHCNAANCPLTQEEDDDDNEDDEDIIGYIRDLKAKLRRANTDYINANKSRKQLERDIKRLGEAYTERADQYSIMQNEQLSIVENSVTLITSALYDLRDKLKESCKRLEP